MKKVGSSEATVHFHREVEVKIPVTVVAENQPAPAVEEAPAESAHDELCDRFVGLSTFPTEGFAEDTELVPEGEERSP